jgi:hypothetical protein
MFRNGQEVTKKKQNKEKKTCIFHYVLAKG